MIFPGFVPRICLYPLENLSQIIHWYWPLLLYIASEHKQLRTAEKQVWDFYLFVFSTEGWFGIYLCVETFGWIQRLYLNALETFWHRPHRAVSSSGSAISHSLDKVHTEPRSHPHAAHAVTLRLMSSLKQGIKGDTNTDVCLYLGGCDEKRDAEQNLRWRVFRTWRLHHIVGICLPRSDFLIVTQIKGYCGNPESVV